jgi:TRAP-type mannitol/chloroaromatic compound transport system permease large subunit
MGAVGAVIVLCRSLLEDVEDTALDTSNLPAIMMFILAAAQVFALAFRGLQG